MIVKLSLSSICWLVSLFLFGVEIDGVAPQKMKSAKMSIYSYGRYGIEGQQIITMIGYDKNQPRVMNNCNGNLALTLGVEFVVEHGLEHIWTWNKEADLPGLTVDFDVGPSPIANLTTLPTIASSPTSITRRNTFSKTLKDQVQTMARTRQIVNVVGTIKQIKVPFSVKVYITYDDGSVHDFVTHGTYIGQEWLDEPHISTSFTLCPTPKSG